jgi:hypothetical protein
MSKISITLPDESLKILNQLSRHTGYSRSALISSIMAVRLQSYSHLQRLPPSQSKPADLKRFRGTGISGLEEVLFTLENQCSLFEVSDGSDFALVSQDNIIPLSQDKT